MRLQLHLRATADAVYDNAYHHKLRGRLWQALDESFDEDHESRRGVGLAFSGPYPWGNIKEGDSLSVLVASPRKELLDSLIADVSRNREFNIGEMAFELEDVTAHDPDVGEPGTEGTLETVTGVVCRLTKEQVEEYGLDTTEMESGSTETRTFWRPKHGMGPLRDSIRHSLQLSHEWFGDQTRPGPYEVDHRLWSSIEPVKDDITYALPFSPATGVERTLIVSKWSLGYRVRNDTHRYHLNLALDCGIGQRREHGFGFVNVEQTGHTSPLESGSVPKVTD